jgi:hypothetical protein
VPRRVGSRILCQTTTLACRLLPRWLLTAVVFTGPRCDLGGRRSGGHQDSSDGHPGGKQCRDDSAFHWDSLHAARSTVPFHAPTASSCGRAFASWYRSGRPTSGYDMLLMRCRSVASCGGTTLCDIASLHADSPALDNEGATGAYGTRESRRVIAGVSRRTRTRARRRAPPSARRGTARNGEGPHLDSPRRARRRRPLDGRSLGTARWRWP